MRPQANRLPPGMARGFSGSAIDRTRRLTFQLDGRQISGFAGDTILSAALASGIDTLGLFDDTPLALTSGAAPVVSYTRLAAEPQQALPMARTPALDGMDLVTHGVRKANPFARLFLPGRTLGLPLDEPHILDRPWRATPGLPHNSSDLVVIGGGVAGMAAALAAAKAGLGVTMVEADPTLGGHSGLFGTQDGEQTPEAEIAGLSRRIAATDAIAVLTATHAFALRKGLVRCHRVDIMDGVVRGQVIDIAARYIVIATGARERLPIFGGNRLPGIIGSRDAYELATRYGIWPGHDALVATSTNVGYRLAMLANDAGIAVRRILDSRAHANSRFVEFSRAYGIVQGPGTIVSHADATRSGGSLAIVTDQPGGEPIMTDRLIVSGGWQPDLTLWHVAGGGSVWHPSRHRLEALGELDGIALAGAAAGLFTRRGCVASGAEAVARLLGGPAKPAFDPVLDVLYDSPDGPTPIGAQGEDDLPAFLDSGAEFLQRPFPRQRHWRDVFKRRHAENGLKALSEAPQPLTVCDVAAGVNLGLIPPDAAGGVAQERVALMALSMPADPRASYDHAIPAETEIPPYLAGRFGPASVVRVVPRETRHLSPGALLYRSSDASNPLDAIGVILRPAEGAAMALVATRFAQSGISITVRDQGRALSAEIG